MPGPQRIGWTDADMVRAQQVLRDRASGGGAHHIVEVLDEGLHEVQSQPGEPVGVLYVVAEEDLEAFQAKHEGCLLIDGAGVSTEGLEEA